MINNKLNLYKTKLYIVAEIHGVKYNSKIKYELLTELNTSMDVTCFFIEMGSYETEGLNQFLKTGNINILNKTIKNRESCYANLDEEIEFWVKLYKFNLQLSESKKIKVIGIDCNGRFRDLLYYAKYLNRNADTDEILKNQIEIQLICLEENLKKDDCIKSLMSITNNIIKKLLKLNFNNIDKLRIVMEEIYTKLNRLNNPKTEKLIRENYMVKRLVDEIQRNKDSNFFGQVGFSHVYKINDNVLPLADCIEFLLGKEYLIKIMIIYKDTIYKKKENNIWIQCKIDMLKIENNITQKLLTTGQFPKDLLNDKNNDIGNILYYNKNLFYILI